MKAGEVVMKTAGRDANQVGVVLEAVDEHTVLISGPLVRKRKVNVKHVSALNETIKVKKTATPEELGKKLEKIGLFDMKKMPKKATKKRTEKKEQVKKERGKKAEKKKLVPKLGKKEAKPEKKAKEDIEKKILAEATAEAKKEK